jgi:heme-degrading monooxygenase HmoA
MTTISVDMPVVTLVNVFTVEPENQQRLTDLLIEATEKTMRHIPGFVSANIYKSLDGTHVANYAQWRREEDWRAMLANPEAGVHMKGALELASVDRYLYRVTHCDAHEET